MTLSAQLSLFDVQQISQTCIRKTFALQTIHPVSINRCKTLLANRFLFFNQVFYLYQEPWINLSDLKDLFERHANAESIADIPKTVCTWLTNLILNLLKRRLTGSLNH